MKTTQDVIAEMTPGAKNLVHKILTEMVRDGQIPQGYADILERQTTGDNVATSLNATQTNSIRVATNNITKLIEN